VQGILHELDDLENLDSTSADDYEHDSVLWMNPCLLLDNSLPVDNAIAKLHVSGKSITCISTGSIASMYTNENSRIF